jgi:hypothetical protein
MSETTLYGKVCGFMILASYLNIEIFNNIKGNRKRARLYSIKKVRTAPRSLKREISKHNIKNI